MKLPLVGGSHQLRSPAASVQQSLNLFPQVIEDGNDRSKNAGLLELCPGYHQIYSIGSATGIRGAWSGGGRLFVVYDLSGDTHIAEISQNTYVPGNPSTGSGAVVSDQDLGPSDLTGNPAQLFGNGNQLGVIVNGKFFISNGAAVAPWTGLSGFNEAVFSFQRLDLVIDAIDPHNCTDALNPFDSSDVGNAMLILDTSGAGWTPQVVIINSVTSGVAACSAVLGTVSSTGGQATEYISIAHGGAVTAVTGTYLDSYFIVQRPSRGSPDLGRQFNISAPNDGWSWDELDFADKTGYSDYLQAVYADHEQLFLMGTETGEAWQNTGNADFPIERIPGAVAREGLTARYSPASLNGKLYYLGGNPRGGPIAYRLDGFTPVRVSTHAEEATWSKLGATALLSSAVAYPTVEDGHQLWVINFGGNVGTWVYDATESEKAGFPLWHQRAHWNGTTFQNYRPRYGVFIPEWGEAGIHIGCDYTNGNIYDVSLDYADENGSDTSAVRILPAIYNAGNRVFYGRMTLEMETGGTTSMVTEPVVTRDYSDDRGVTFVGTGGGADAQGFGLAGNTSKQVFWKQGGQGRFRNWRFTITGKVRLTLIDLDCEMWMAKS